MGLFDDTESKIGDALAEREEKETQSKVAEEVEKIKLGEDEYSKDELSKLVGLGKIAREAEDKYNTKIDRVWPEYTQKTQRIIELEKQIEAGKAKQAPQQPTFDETSIAQAKEAAKKIGIVTEDQFSEYMGKSFRQFYVNERAAEKLLDECDDLEGEINGTDGRPKFDKKAILEYMRDTGIRSPEKAYKDKFEKQLDTWKESQLNIRKTPGMYTQESQTTGNKTPREVKVTKDNLDAMIHEALNAGGNLDS